MIEIGVNNLTKYYGADKIFENVTFDIKTKDKIGLVGRNGTGKTTLIKILADYENFQSGQINKRKELVMGYLEQIPNYTDENKVSDVIKQAFENLIKIKEQMNEYEKQFEKLKDEELERVVKRYSELHDLYEISGGYNTDEKLNKVLNGLNITEEMLQRNFNTLSGGEKTRVVLGKILLQNPDLLLLDEPSNHLDIKSVEWLEEYLKNYEGTIIMVSHDRYFLDKVANIIIELEQDGVEIYNGNYSKYVVEKELRFLQAMKEYEAQQKNIKKMEQQIQRYRIWGEMRDSDKMYKRAKELEKKLEKIEQLQKPITDKKAASFKSNGVSRTGKEVVKVENISKSYNDKRLFEDVSFTVFYKDNLCILGENGTGKSTVLKIIIEEIKSDTGQVKIGSNVKIGYLPQEVSFDKEDISIASYFSYHYGISISEARKELSKIMFTGEDVYKHISSLSGGEKSKLKLGMLIYEKVNLLILDEPTNHLDIDSREVLEEDLLNFKGTILFVSHDRYFVDKIATCIGEIENRCFKIYNFNYEAFKQEKQRIEEAKTDSINIEDKKEKSITQNKEDYLRKKEEIKRIEKQKRDLQNIENNIFESESKLVELEKILNTNSTQWDLEDYNNKYNEYNELREKIDMMYTELNKHV